MADQEYFELTDSAQTPIRDHQAGDKAMVINGGEVALVDQDSVQAAMAEKFDTLQAQIQGRLAFETLADLQASGAPASGESAEVLLDGSNNGIYMFIDGGWVKSDFGQPAAISKISLDGKSIRFYERNGLSPEKLSSSGVLWQSKTGMPVFMGANTSFGFKLKIPFYATAENRAFKIMGTGKYPAGFYFAFYGQHFNSAINAKKLKFYVRVSGSVQPIQILTDEIDSEDVQIVVVDDGQEIHLYVIDAQNGGIISATSATGTTAGGITSLSGDGFLIGGSGNAGILTGYDEPNGLWPGSISDVFMLSSALSEAQLADIVVADTQRWLTDNAPADVRFYRSLAGIDGCKNSGDFVDSSADTEIIGRVYSGSSIGRCGSEFWLNEKPVGFIAGISGPSASSAEMMLDCMTDGAIAGVLECQVLDADGYALTSWMAAATLSSGNTTATARVRLPVTNKWLAIDFRCGSSSLMHRNPVAAGVKIQLIGQSQMVIFSNSTDLGITQNAIPASLCRLNSPTGYETLPSLIRVDDQAVSDGIAAMLTHWSAKNSIPVCIIADCVAGTGVDQWLDDADPARQWQLSADMTMLAGRDVSAYVWAWVTNNQHAAADYMSKIFQPLLDGKATGSDAESAREIAVVDHTLFDGTFRSCRDFIIMPATGHRTTSGGPFDADSGYANVSLARDSQALWADVNGIVGPFTSDIEIANGGIANSGGPHQNPDSWRGNPRIGVRIAEALCRWNRSSTSKNPVIDRFVFTDSGKTSINMIVMMPNYGHLQTDGSESVTGIELSADGGATWSRSGFAAAIVASDTVRISKVSGSWSDGLLARYQFGGPWSYGTAVDEISQITGCLYDGTNIDGSDFGDLLGIPVSGSSEFFTVRSV
ncbi:hypothetical protein [Oceanobacter antarcticus]|uniref:Concanavalin A-like lectin/glucanases superfamily protein n=1 Tax=Oceanobacter antarcticus TaxID=3133425 RepID=A0ABW8NEP8_9GAMM